MPIPAPQNMMSVLGKMECYYLDYNVASKEAVLSAYGHIREKLGTVPPPGVAVLQTCLRNEIYILDRSLVPEDFFDSPELAEYVHIKGKRCLLRLVRLLCGLQSELTGEMEIFGQTGAAFNEAANARRITATQFSSIAFILGTARALRKKHSFELNENYSTVGADLINSRIEPGTTIGLVGSGYMMASFLRAFDCNSVARLVWVNRSKDNARKLAKELRIPGVPLDYLDIEEGRKVLPQCDFIFAAATNCDGLYADLELIQTKCIVDVSYPPLFSRNAAPETYSLKNTYFERLVRNPLSKEAKRELEAEIEDLVCNVW